MAPMELLIPALSKLLSALVPVFVVWVGHTVRRRYKVEIDEIDERRLREFANQGIAWAEEQARKATKTDSMRPLPAEKLDMAKAFVARRVIEARLNKKKVLPQAVHEIVEAELGRKRDVLTGVAGRREAN